MVYNKDLKVSCMISLDSYKCKDDARAAASTIQLARAAGYKRKMAFASENVTVDEIVDRLTSGYCICNNFEPEVRTVKSEKGYTYEESGLYKDGSLKMSGKNDRSWKSSQIIYIDVDDTALEFNQYINILKNNGLNPSFAYLSYSDNKDKGGKVCRRFRLGYVLDKPETDMDDYKLEATSLILLIERFTNEKMADDCTTRASQYYNGSCYKECYKSYSVYEKDYFVEMEIEFETEERNEIDCINYYECTDINDNPVIDTNSLHIINDLEKVNTTEDPLELDEDDVVTVEFDEYLVKDMEEGWETFNHYHCRDYNFNNSYIYHNVTIPEDADYIETPENYMSLYYYGEKGVDGTQRRKNIFKRTLLRRVMNPEADPNQLLYCAYYDREFYFDNSDEVITVECLMKNVSKAFEFTPEEIEVEFSELIKEAKDNGKKRNPNRIYNTKKLDKKAIVKTINKERKMNNWKKIEDVYNPKLTVKENLQLLKDNGIKCSKSSLYTFANEHGYKTSDNTTKEEILALYNWNESLRKNVEVIKSMGIKISAGKLSSIINEYKDNINNNTTTDTTDTNSLHIINELEKMNSEDEPVLSVEVPELSWDFDPFKYQVTVKIEADKKPVKTPVTIHSEKFSEVWCMDW